MFAPWYALIAWGDAIPCNNYLWRCSGWNGNHGSLGFYSHQIRSIPERRTYGFTLTSLVTLVIGITTKAPKIEPITQTEAVVGWLVVASTYKPQVPVNSYLHERTLQV